MNTYMISDIIGMVNGSINVQFIGCDTAKDDEIFTDLYKVTDVKLAIASNRFLDREAYSATIMLSVIGSAYLAISIDDSDTMTEYFDDLERYIAVFADIRQSDKALYNAMLEMM